jgi:hypothetical protein
MLWRNLVLGGAVGTLTAAQLQRTCLCKERNAAANTKQAVSVYEHTFDIQIITEEERFLLYGIQGQENYVS